MESLYKRIRDHVSDQCNKVLQKQYKHLVVFAGNGLTRIAAAMTKGAGDPSWRKWIADCVMEVGIEQDLDYLVSLNYSFDHIFSLMIKKAESKGISEKKLWKHLWDATKTLRPSPLHSVIVGLANSIITTNYDTLFEQAAAAGREDVQWKPYNVLRDPPLVVPSANIIWKLHGSFPEQSAVDPKNDEPFNAWVLNKQEGPNRTVATERTYLELAMIADEDTFKRTFGKVIEILHDKESLVIFLGLGLGAEELVVTRLLALAAPAIGDHRWIAFEAPEELDPLYRLEKRNIHPIGAPLGLCGGSLRRALAILAVLDCFVETFALGLTEGEKEMRRNLIGTCLKDDRFLRSAFKDNLGDSAPVVVSIGQSSINRMIGLERGVSQEAAYAAIEATWTPDADARKRALVSREVGGQALIPTLVWDALRIPCGLISEVRGDDFGREVLQALARAEWVDFTGVSQIGKQKGVELQEPTDNATVVTWFGVRTLIDALRSNRPFLRMDSALLDLEPRVVYITKRGWKDVKRKLEAMPNYEPLIVFETGGTGEVEAETWVASRKGIVIGSAVAALWWMNPDVEATINSDPNDLDAIQKARDKWIRERREKEVKDDRGRLFQTEDVLESLRTEHIPLFLQTNVSDLQLYAITLGELGMIYWTKDNRSEWAQPRWCASTEVQNEKEPLDDEEIRNGTECGDAARAGFVAALLLRASGHLRVGPQSTDDLDLALAWGNWFGACKLQFFSLIDYIAFLRREEEYISNRIREGNPPGLKRVGNVHDLDFENVDVFVGNQMHHGLENWLTTTLAWRNKEDRKAWEIRIQAWADKRLGRKP